MSYSFLTAGLIFLWLNLLQSILLFFDEIVNGIVILISLSKNLLLVYKNATNF